MKEKRLQGFDLDLFVAEQRIVINRLGMFTDVLWNTVQ